MTRLHYAEWRAAIEREVDWAALHERLVAIVATDPSARATAKDNQRFAPATFTAIWRALSTAATWTGGEDWPREEPSGNQPGDEAVRGWCWCHGPWRSGRSPEAIAKSIVAELRECRAWHLGVLAWIAASEPPGRDPVALARLVAGVVDLVVELGINDSWYGLIVPVTAWTLERHAFGVPAELVDEIDRLCSLSFTSWTAPPAKARREFAEEVALAMLEREMKIRWPDA